MGTKQRVSSRVEELEDRVERLEESASLTRPTSAGESAGDLARHCGLPPVPERVFASGVSPNRAGLIRVSAKKWVNGTTLRYYFFAEDDGGEEVLLSNGQRQ